MTLKRLLQVDRVLDRLARDGTVRSGSDGTMHELSPVAISRLEGEALRTWITREGATRTIELGLGYGVAALYTCDGLLRNGNPAAQHVTLDPNQRSRFGAVGLLLLEEAGLEDLVEFHPSPSEIALPSFLQAGRRFDFAVVDANHRFDGVFVDLVYLGRLVRPGGILFIDDYQLPAIARAAAYFVSNLDWRLEEVSAPDELHQWAVLRTAAAPDRRRYDHFVDF